MLKTGEFYALLTAVCWSVTALCFEFAGKRVGTLALNIIRLVIAFAFIAVYSLIRTGTPVPLTVSIFTWKWLLFSGFIGFVLGDFFLFKGFINIGARISMLIMSLAPVFSAIIDFMITGETLSFFELTGVTVTLLGITIVITGHGNGQKPGYDRKKAVKGVVYAVLGSLGQAGGLVISKYAILDTDPFVATQIRIIAGITGFAVIILFSRKGGNVIRAVKDRTALKYMIAGSFFGPFLGVSFSLAAVKFTGAGIASTIMSIVPVILIFPAIFIFHEKIRFREVAGALVSVAGVAMLFL
ncbi:MAG: DMT family transporter [Spirochaetes bacterium]|nr:DMT family transporter [Spirochaetota bacterium]